VRWTGGGDQEESAGHARAAEELEASLQAADTRALDAEAQLANARSGAAAELERARDENAGLRNALEAAERAAEQAEERAGRTAAQADKAVAAAAKGKDAAARAEAALGESRAKAGELEAERDVLLEARTSLCSQITALESSSTQLEAQLQRVRGELAASEQARRAAERDAATDRRVLAGLMLHAQVRAPRLAACCPVPSRCRSWLLAVERATPVAHRAWGHLRSQAALTKFFPDPKGDKCTLALSDRCWQASVPARLPGGLVAASRRV